MPLRVTALVAAVCATAGTATASEKSAAQQAAALTPSVNLMIAILLRLWLQREPCCGRGAPRRPDLKMLSTTRYARDAIVSHGRLAPGAELILKPCIHAAMDAK